MHRAMKGHRPDSTKGLVPARLHFGESLESEKKKYTPLSKIYSSTNTLSYVGVREMGGHRLQHAKQLHAPAVWNDPNNCFMHMITHPASSNIWNPLKLQSYKYP